nr:hypothetical protein BaRGS_030785 [Batillaria attramentaria]
MMAILAQTSVDEEGNKLDINPFSDYFDLTLMGPAQSIYVFVVPARFFSPDQLNETVISPTNAASSVRVTQ